MYNIYTHTYNNNNNNNKENKLHKSLWEWEAPWHHIEGALVLKHGKERNAACEKSATIIIKEVEFHASSPQDLWSYQIH